MTNSEHFEKNKISFTEAMEIFNKQKSKKGGTKSFDKFLASKHVEHKFKAGDLIVLQLTDEVRSNSWKHNIVFEVVNIECEVYELKFLTPQCGYGINAARSFSTGFIDRNCVLY